MKTATKLTLAISAILAVLLTAGAWLIWQDIDTWAAGHFNDQLPEVADYPSFAQVQQSMRQTFLTTGAGVVLLAALAVYLTVRQVTRPLTELAQTARRFGEGDLDCRIQVGAEDEAGVLAMAFNRMAESLQNYHDTLEQKVEARSRQLEASQRQVLQAGKLASIGELASGVAHELNNPAGIILMRTTRLAEEIAQQQLSAEAQEDVEVIKRQVEKIRRIVSGLLTFSRRSSSALKPVDLNEVVQRTTSLIEELIHNRGIALKLDLSPILPQIQADSAQLEQVILNLVNNALDAMPQNGCITFRTTLAEDDKIGQSVCLVVEDTGVGIPAAYLTRLFDPFFTTKEVGQGTGLGLSISYGIMEEHGGAIRVESQPGQGSRFALYFPLAGKAVRQREG